MKINFHTLTGTTRQTVIIVLLGLIISWTGCKKDPPISIRPTFVPSEVLFQLYDTVSFKSTYKLFDKLKIKIEVAYDFNYLIRTTTDSIDTIKLILKSKPYLTIGGQTFTSLYLRDTLRISVNFHNLDSIVANDWLSTVGQLHLKENLSGNFFKWGVATVPVGQEQYWVDKLKQYNIIKSSELDGIFYPN